MTPLDKKELYQQTDGSQGRTSGTEVNPERQGIEVKEGSREWGGVNSPRSDDFKHF